MNPQAFTNTLRSRMIENAMKQKTSMQNSADGRFQARVQDLLNREGGFDPNDVAEGIRGEARGNQERVMPITNAIYGDQKIAQEVRRATSAEDEDFINQLGGMAGSVPLAEAMAGNKIPGMREGAARMGASVMGAMADEGTKGDIARIGAVSAGVAGLTASGAALIDLMQFLTQGQEVDQERNQILPS